MSVVNLKPNEFLVGTLNNSDIKVIVVAKDVENAKRIAHQFLNPNFESVRKSTKITARPSPIGFPQALFKPIKSTAKTRSLSPLSGHSEVEKAKILADLTKMATKYWTEERAKVLVKK